MKVKLIGTYKGKIVFPLISGVHISYHLDNVILKDDFDNNRIEGHCDFFTNKKDCTDFVIPGYSYEINKSLRKFVNLTSEQIQLMDSLEEGDVVVLDGEVLVETRCGVHDLYSYFSRFKNIKKYDDDEAADKIKEMVSETPLKFEYLPTQTKC